MITSPAFAASTTTMPLLVMDIYEHSYQMDFGAATAKYVDVFFRNIRWEAVLCPARFGEPIC